MWLNWRKPTATRRSERIGMTPFTKATRAVAQFLRLSLVVVLVAPIFWMMASRIWLPFTPEWLDIASLWAAGVSVVVLLVLSAFQKPFDYKKRVDAPNTKYSQSLGESQVEVPKCPTEFDR